MNTTELALISISAALAMNSPMTTATSNDVNILMQDLVAKVNPNFAKEMTKDTDSCDHT